MAIINTTDIILIVILAPNDILLFSINSPLKLKECEFDTLLHKYIAIY